MRTYSDEYLNYYADRYVALYLKGHGVTLVRYLANPAYYEPLAEMPLPLLPEQRLVQARLDAEAARVEASVEHLPRRNGAAMERLRHTRHPRRSPLGWLARRVKERLSYDEFLTGERNDERNS